MKLVVYEVYMGNHPSGKSKALKGENYAAYAYAAAQEGRDDLVEQIPLSRAGVSVADRNRRGHGRFVNLYAFRILDTAGLVKFIEKHYPELI